MAGAKDLGALVGQIGADTAQWERAARQIRGDLDKIERAGKRATGNVSKSFTRMGRKMRSVGRDMSMRLTAPLAAAGTAIFKLGSDFETEMSKIVGLVGESQEQVSAWGQQIRDLSGDVAVGPRELSEAMFFVTSAGFEGAEAMDVLEMSAKAAAAGLGETKSVADLTTSAINAYGSDVLDASGATDILTAAVREGKLEAETLAPVLGQVLPIASELSIGFDEVAGFMAAMSRTGLNARRGVTALRSAMNTLVKPTADAEKQLGEIGLSVAELREMAGRQGLVPVLMQLKESFQGNQEAMSNVFPNVRALTAVLNVLGQDSETVKGIMDGVAQSAGDNQRAFEAAADTGKFAFNAMLSEAKSLAVELYQTLQELMLPAFDSMRQVLKDFKTAWRGFSDEARTAVFAVAGMLGAGGPILTALGILSMAIGAISAPLVGVVTAVSAAAGAIIANWEEVTDFFSTGEGYLMWVTVKEEAMEMWEIIRETFQAGVTFISKFWNQFGDDITKSTRQAFSVMAGLIKDFFKTAKFTLEVFSGEWSSAWDTLMGDTEDRAKTARANILGYLDFSDLPIVRLLDFITPGGQDGFLMEDFKESMKETRDVAYDMFGQMENPIEGFFQNYKRGANIFKRETDLMLDKVMQLQAFLNMDLSAPSTSGGGEEGEEVSRMDFVEDWRMDEGLEKITKFTNKVREVKDVSVSAFDDMKAAGAEFSSVTEAALNSSISSWDEFNATVMNVSEQLKTVAIQQIQQAVLSFGETIGKTLAGVENTFATTFEKIALIMLDFAKSLIKLAAGIGALMLFIPGMQGTGAGMLAASAALQAIVTGVESGIQKRIRNREQRQENSQSVNDAIIHKDGSRTRLHPKDGLLAMKDFKALGIPNTGKMSRSSGQKPVIENRLYIDGREVEIALEDSAYGRNR